MSRKMQTSESVGGESKRITKPGTFHGVIMSGSDGESTTGKSITGCSCVVSVLAGTEADQVGNEFHLHLFDPDSSKTEKEQEMPRKKQTAYAIAINQINPNQLGKEVEVNFDNDAVAGHQIVFTLERDKREGKSDEIQLSYDSIFHVDDPRASKFPKDAKYLSKIPAEFRQKAEFFSSLTEKAKKPNGNGAPKITDTDVDDL